MRSVSGYASLVITVFFRVVVGNFVKPLSKLINATKQQAIHSMLGGIALIFGFLQACLFV
uniref:Threonine efflux protein n=1 Tax=Echinococcus granulosus TaxID=6210 RepID=A0A068WCW6_ECHGR|nr:hypothetical protein EgrG_000785200 [Echinococcus granulosus]